jgi:HSP20 family protein
VSTTQPTTKTEEMRRGSGGDESAALHATDGLRGAGSPPDYFGRPEYAREKAAAASHAEQPPQVQQSISEALAPGRLNPFQAINQIREQMDRLFGELTGLSGLMAPWQSAMGRARDLLPAVWTPPVDISETDDAWTIEAEVPGAKPEDVVVEVRDRQLAIRGEVKEGEGEARQRTRRVGRFDYRVTIPAEIDADRIEGRLDNGVLKLTLPKRSASSRRRISIAA